MKILSHYLPMLCFLLITPPTHGVEEAQKEVAQQEKAAKIAPKKESPSFFEKNLQQVYRENPIAIVVGSYVSFFYYIYSLNIYANIYLFHAFMKSNQKKKQDFLNVIDPSTLLNDNKKAEKFFLKAIEGSLRHLCLYILFVTLYYLLTNGLLAYGLSYFYEDEKYPIKKRFMHFFKILSFVSIGHLILTIPHMLSHTFSTFGKEQCLIKFLELWLLTIPLFLIALTYLILLNIYPVQGECGQEDGHRVDE